VLKEKAVGGYAVARIATVLALDDLSESFDGEMASAYFDKSADDGTDHVAQETVGLYGEHPSVVVAWSPSGMHDAAVVGLHIGVQLAETGKVSVEGKAVGGSIHEVEIEDVAHTPGILAQKGMLATGDVVAVCAAGGIETGMGFRSDVTYFIHADVGWQQAIELGCYLSSVEWGRGIEMGHHESGMHARIGAPCSHHLGRKAQESGKRFL